MRKGFAYKIVPRKAVVDNLLSNITGAAIDGTMIISLQRNVMAKN